MKYIAISILLFLCACQPADNEQNPGNVSADASKESVPSALATVSSVRDWAYPETAQDEQVDDYHGTVVADPYRWLEDDVRVSEKVADWVAAHCYYKLLNALDTHNLGRGHISISEALKKIKCQTSVLGIDTDLFIPVEEQKFLVEHIPNAQYLEIKSIYGHDAFLIEIEQIQNFLLQKEMVAKD